MLNDFRLSQEKQLTERAFRFPFLWHLQPMCDSQCWNVKVWDGEDLLNSLYDVDVGIEVFIKVLSSQLHD